MSSVTEMTNKIAPIVDDKFPTAEWARKNWMFITAGVALLSPILAAYTMQFIGQVSVTKTDFSVFEKQVNDSNRAMNDTRIATEAAMRVNTETNARQDLQIQSLQQAVGDIKDSVKDMQSDVKLLIRGGNN
jgi:hypothetical protein